MADENHNTKVYSLQEVANLVERTPASIRNYVVAGRVEAQKIGNVYVISERGLEQAREIVATAKPGPKGPRRVETRPRRRKAA